MISKLAKQAMLDKYRSEVVNFGLGSTMRLFKNDYVPTVDSLVADFSECNFGGYTSIGVAAATLQVDPVTGEDIIMLVPGGSMAADGTNPQVCYGYYVVSDGGLLVTAHRFTVPKAMAVNGDILVVTAFIELAQQIAVEAEM